MHGTVLCLANIGGEVRPVTVAVVSTVGHATVVSMHTTVAGCYSYGRRLACIRLQPGHIRLQVKTLRSHPAEASVMGLAEGSGSAAADLTFAGDGGDEGISESSTQGAWEKVTPNPNSNPDPDPDPDPN